jgi:hypothetical protein
MEAMTSKWSSYRAGRFVLRRTTVRFRPGACESPILGEASFAAFTNSSKRFLGTARMPRMTSLKCWNSGVESNGAAFILSPLEHGLVVRVLGAYGEEVASSTLLFARQLFVGNPPSNNLLHDSDKSFRVGQVSIVVAIRLFVKIAEQMERLDADVCAMQAALQQRPKILHRVGVNIAIHVLNRVIDNAC